MSTCPACGATFGCGMVDADAQASDTQPCWCTQLPTLSQDGIDAIAATTAPADAPGTARCLCPACLRRRKSQLTAQT